MGFEYIRWMDILETGVPEIDSDHRQLVTAFNALVTMSTQEGCQDAITQGVADIAQLLRKHFAREEAVMKRHRFPRIEAHRKEHVLFATALEDALQNAQYPSASETRHLELLERVHFLLLDILVRHDLDYKSHLHHELGHRDLS
jgi:hemerythrin